MFRAIETVQNPLSSRTPAPGSRHGFSCDCTKLMAVPTKLAQAVRFMKLKHMKREGPA